jgi:hypothetical protein
VTNKIVEITLFLYLTIFLTTRAATLIHEVLGHGLASVLMGGYLTGISINLFTTGSASYELINPGLIQRVIAALAGIVANLVSGVICLMVLKRARLQWEVTIMLCVFAMVSIGSQLTYLVMGTYYAHGDPLVFAELLGPMSWIAWVFFLGLTAPAAYLLARSYLELQEKMFPCDSLMARAGVLLSTLMAASVIYSVCFYAESGTTGFLGGMAGAERTITEKAEEAVEGRLLTEEERKREIEAIKKELRPFPIIVLLVLVGCLSSLLAFLKTKDWSLSAMRYQFRVKYLWCSLCVALVMGATIVTAHHLRVATP